MQHNSVPPKLKIRAPARTCLFGDHQDYLGLPVIACAINRYINLCAQINNTNVLFINLPDLGTTREISLDASIADIPFGDHFLSAIKVLRAVGCVPTHGYDIDISGNIAINAGTSSSSAVVVAWVKFLLAAFGCDHEIDNEFVAKLAYEAEVLEQGGAGGKMDQYSIALGNIIYLETDENTNYEVVPKLLPGLIVGESGIPKETNAVLKELRDLAIEAAVFLKDIDPSFNLASVDVDELDFYKHQLPEELQMYFYAAVMNHSITKKAKQEFDRPNLDLKRIGILMNDHHHILKEVLNITLPLIDDMIEAAMNAGAYGAKIVGSGKGGSIVVLSPIEKSNHVVNAIKKVGKDAYEVLVDSGAKVLKN